MFKEGKFQLIGGIPAIIVRLKRESVKAASSGVVTCVETHMLEIMYNDKIVVRYAGPAMIMKVNLGDKVTKDQVLFEAVGELRISACEEGKYLNPQLLFEE